MAKVSDTLESETQPLLKDGTRIGAVVSLFHRELTGAMLESAKRELVASGMAEEDLVTLWVPGTFELPLVARRLAVRADIDAVICLGLVLKGETTHDVYIAQATANGLMSVGMQVDKPVLFGVLTCNTLEQAQARALSPEQGGSHDKGREVARAAVLQINALKDAADQDEDVEPAGFGRPGQTV